MGIQPSSIWRVKAVNWLSSFETGLTSVSPHDELAAVPLPLGMTRKWLLTIINPQNGAPKSLFECVNENDKGWDGIYEENEGNPYFVAAKVEMSALSATQVPQGPQVL